MESTLERRNERSERVPLQIAVELGEGDFRDAFAGHARNLSRGGISMRAACLPDIGSRLLCRFRSLPSDTLVTAQGEVVWAHLEGGRSGEFGLAFVDLDPQTEWLIEEMLAERAAHDGGAHGDEVSAPVGTLELEGSPEAIAARVTSEGPDRAVFEQELDLLRVGRGVRAHAPSAGGRAGSISKVELRMVGSVPMLAVTVAFDGARAEQAAAEAPQVPASDDPAAYAHDTEPDLRAPELADEDGGSHAEAIAKPAEPLAQHADAAEERAPSGEPPQAAYAPPREPSCEAPIESGERASLHPVQAAPADRDFSTSFALPPREAPCELRDDEPDLDFEAMAAPAWKSALSRGTTLLLQGLRALIDQAYAQLQVAYRKASPRLRGALLRAATVVRHAYLERVAPQLGALRRLIAGQLGMRRRRKTAVPGRARASSGSLGRTLLLGVLGAAGSALAVYALMPANGGEIDLHRPVRAEAAAQAAGSSPAPGAPAATAASAQAAQATAAAPAAEKPDPAVVPSAKRVPEGSPFAVDVRSKPAAAAPKSSAGAAGKMRFGADKVPYARRFTLRMSNAVKSVEGAADDGGFTVKLMGTLSLDRAGPISSAHKAVQRSMVINRGDRAELTIRFVDGKRPAYQVSAEGHTVHVSIEDR